MAKTHIFTPLLKREARPHRLLNRTRAVVMAERIEPAFDSKARRRGLLGRETLPADSVMAIAPSNAVHTFAMRFPIDLLFIARDGRVIKRAVSLPARRISAALSAFAVLEFAAGHAGVSQTAVGDYLTLEEISIAPSALR
jgi:uncharacterized membrane protein (UPF0127 family)